MEAVLDGLPDSHVKDKIGQLEARKADLEGQLEGATQEPVLLHPNMADYYRQQASRLREALTDEGHRTESAAPIRTLIDKIVLTPLEREGRETLWIDLHGDIASILALAGKTEKPSPRDGIAKT